MTEQVHYKGEGAYFFLKIFGPIYYANISTNHKGYMIDMGRPIQL